MIPLLLITQRKKTLQEFLSKKNKSEPSNLISIMPNGSEYSIEQIREIAKDLKVSNPIKRMYVLENFENSSLEAQNAFLKLLEEPPANVQFILTVANPYSLLPTIISRTKIHRLEKWTEISIDPSFTKSLKKLLSEKRLSSLDFSIFSVTTREKALDVIIQLCIFFRQRFASDKFSASIAKEIIFSYQLVKNNNINAQLAVDHLLIFIAKKYSIKEK